MTKSKPPPKRNKITDAERHKRFLEVARRVEASDDPEDFDKALKEIASKPPKRD